MRGKKIVLAMLALMMTVTVGAACGKNPDSGDGGSSGGTQITNPNVSVSLDKTTATVGLFDTLTLAATVTGSNASATFRSSDEAVAIVSPDGVVTPQKAGSVTITATVDGVSASCSVTVSAPQEAIELVTVYDVAGLSLEEGRTEKLSPVGYLGVKELTEGAYTYESTDTAVATVSDDGTVTAVSVGNTTIKIKGTFKGITVESSVSVSVQARVTHDEENISVKISYYANRQESLSIDLSAYNFTEIQSIAIDGQNYAFAMDGKTLNVARTAFADIAGGDKNILITGLTETGDITINAKMLYVNYAIGTVDEFNAFRNVYFNLAENANGGFKYVILTADIDMSEQAAINMSGKGSFYGTFDGQGYTINGLKLNYGLFYKTGTTDAEQTVIKNVAFTNAQDTATYAHGGLFGYVVYDVLIDNVYIDYTVNSNNTSTYTSAIACWAWTGKTIINNTFVNLTPKTNTNGSLIYGYQQGGMLTVSNVYVINAKNTTLDGTQTGNIYADEVAFKAAVTALPEGFNADLWEMKDSMLVFKSALNYAVNAVEIALEGEATEIIRGASMSFTATAGATISAVGENVEGITISGNTVAVASAVAGGTTFKLRATYFDTITGKTLTAESCELTVVTSEEVTLEGVRTAAKNRNEKLTLDLSAYSITELTSVTIGTAAIDLASVTFDNGILEIAVSALPGGLDVNVSIAAKKAEGYVTATATVSVYDYAIGTVDEFNAFRNVYYALAENANGGFKYVILTADIDMSSVAATNMANKGSFYGIFDGQGHTINGLKLNYGLFYKTGTTDAEQTVIKNVAFTNAQDTATYAHGGLFGYVVYDVLIDNVYIDYTVNSNNTSTYTSAIACWAWTGKTIINNTFVNLTPKTNTNGSLIYGYQQGGTLTASNVYVIDAKNTTLDGTQTGNIYADEAAFKAAVTALPEGFNSEYWEMRAGMLVFKSALTYAVTEISVAFNDEKTELVAGSSIGFTASAGVSLSISGENTEGITINGNQVNVASTVAGGTKFKLVATYFDTITGQPLTAESAEMTVVNEARLETMDGEQTVAKNRNGNLELDLSAYNITELTAVKIGDAAVTAYTFEAGKLTVASGDITENGHLNITIEAQTATGDLTVSAKAYVVDYAIGTVDEFNAFRNVYVGLKDGENGGFKYVILTADIDMSSVAATNMANKGSFYGIFDGQGHTIDGLNLVYGLFYKTGTTGAEQTVIKNVAFTNAQDTTSNGSAHAGLFGFGVYDLLIDNVYIDYTINSTNESPYTSAIACWAYGNLVMNNTFVNLTPKSDTNGSLVVGFQGSGKLTVSNVYVINAKNTTLDGKQTGNIYADEAAFKAAVTALPEGFNSEYWEIKDSMLVFKTAVAYETTAEA